MPLGTEVGLGLNDSVLDGDPAPHPKKLHSRPLFGPCLLWPNGRPSQLLLSSCCTKVPTKRSGMDHTVLPANNTMLLLLILYYLDFFRAFLYTFVVRFHTLLKCVFDFSSSVNALS